MARAVKPPTVSIASIAAVVVTLAAAVACAAFSPLTGTPGPEAAHVLSVVGGIGMLLSGAARGGYKLKRGFGGDLAIQAIPLVLSFAGFCLIIFGSSWSHESCAPGRGYAPLFVLALPVLFLCATTGLFLGRAFGRPSVSVVATIIIIFGYAFWIAAEVWLAPSFRFLTHFAVAIDGDLLRGRDLSATVMTFRAATLLFGIAVTFLGFAAYPRSTSGGLSSRGKQNPWMILAAITLASAAATHFMVLRNIGADRAALDAKYTLVRTAANLKVVADPSRTNQREIDAILGEASLWAKRINARLGLTPSEEITIFLHHDYDELSKWTGAENVHFALPWKREIHIARPSIPHPTLGHELAHVLAAEWSDDLFEVPSRMFIFINSGVVEGLAMAATPELKLTDSLTLKEQAAALRRANLAPKVEDLFDQNQGVFTFWTGPPGRGYIIAGALMQTVLEVRGKEAVETIYREGSLEAGFDDEESLEAFLNEYSANLDSMVLPQDAIHSVAARHGGAGILHETCVPDDVERRRQVIQLARGGDFEAAEKLVVQAAPASIWIRLGDIATRLGDDERALRYFDAAAKNAISDGNRQRTLMLRADTLFALGKTRDAQSTYERINLNMLPPAEQRLVQAKRYVSDALRRSAGSDELSKAMMEFLLQRQSDGGDDATRLLGISELSADPAADPEMVTFARYLVARQLLQRGVPSKTLATLLRNLEAGHVLRPPFDEQALRALAMAHARRGDLGVAIVGFESVAEKSARRATQVRMRDFAERAQFIKDGAFDGAQWLLGMKPGGSF